MSARHDLYGPIHKGLRLALSDLLVRIGRTDFTAPEGAETLAALRAQLVLSEEHLRHEEDYIHGALELRRPGAAAVLESQHRHHDETFIALRRLIETLETAPAAGKPAAARALYLAFSRFVADDLAHMAEEETVVLPLLHDLFSDAELQEIEGSLVASLRPEDNLAYLRLMLPAGAPDERFAFLSFVKAHAPAEAFEAIMSFAARPSLSEAEYARLSERLAA